VNSRDQSEIPETFVRQTSFVREFNVWAGILRSSFVTVEEKTLVIQQGMERVVDSHWLWAVITDCNCKELLINFNHRIQNPLLLVTPTPIRDNMIFPLRAMSFKWAIHFILQNKTLYSFFFSVIHVTCPPPVHPLSSDHVLYFVDINYAVHYTVFHPPVTLCLSELHTRARTHTHTYIQHKREGRSFISFIL
jgi:hypothetical protein